MRSNQRILAVVPARGGSKGVKLKNLRDLGGMPLVAHVGKLLKTMPWVDRAVVSTDHDEIARVAEASGLAAPFRRPESLSGDRVSDTPVLVHALESCEAIDGVTYDIVLMLQPTSPLRTAGQVEATVDRLVSGEYDAVWTVSASDPKLHPLKQLALDEGGAMRLYDPAGADIIARQQLTPLYHRNGVAYAFTRSCLLEQGTIYGRSLGAVLIEDPVANIDTEEDFRLAEDQLSGSFDGG